LENRTKAYGWNVAAMLDSFKRQYLIAEEKEYSHGTGLTDKEVPFFAAPVVRRKRSPA
jgi:hypothetical protein